MTAIAKTRPVDYTRLSLSVLRELACQMHPEHDEEATREYVARLIDLELERRLDLVHRRPGWHPHSPGFGAGEGRGTAPVDAMFMAYERGIPNSYWHDVARRALATLSSRRLLATLIQAAKADHRLDGPFAATHDQIAANLKHYAQMLGFAPSHPVQPEVCRDESGQIVRLTKKIVDRKTGEETETTTSRPKWNAELFRNGQAIKRAAWEARMELILQAKGGGPR